MITAHTSSGGRSGQGGLWVIRAGLKTENEEEQHRNVRGRETRLTGVMEYQYLSASGSTAGKRGRNGEGRRGGGGEMDFGRKGGGI